MRILGEVMPTANLLDKKWIPDSSKSRMPLQFGIRHWKFDMAKKALEHKEKVVLTLSWFSATASSKKCRRFYA